METNHLLSRRNFYSLSYRDTRGNDIIRCINTASSSRTNPGESHFFFFSKHNFPRLRYILKIHSVWGIFLSAAKNRKKRKKKGEEEREEKSKGGRATIKQEIDFFESFMFLPAYRRDTDNFHLERFISWRARLSYELKEFYKRVSDSLLTITRDTFISRPCIFFL